MRKALGSIPSVSMSLRFASSARTTSQRRHTTLCRICCVGLAQQLLRRCFGTAFPKPASCRRCCARLAQNKLRRNLGATFPKPASRRRCCARLAQPMLRRNFGTVSRSAAALGGWASGLPQRSLFHLWHACELPQAAPTRGWAGSRIGWRGRETRAARRSRHSAMFSLFAAEGSCPERTRFNMAEGSNVN